MVNKFIGIGHLCDDPKRQEFNDNKKCSFSIAINSTKTEVLFLNVEAWNKLCDNCCEYLTKGSCVYIEGKVKSSKWEDKSGNKRTNFFVSAEIVRFLPNSKRDEEKKVEKPQVSPNISNIIGEEEPPF
jgi:single-strand DNA-binding protein